MPKQIFVVTGDRGGVGVEMFCQGLSGTLHAMNIPFAFLNDIDLRTALQSSIYSTITDAIDDLLQIHECVIVNCPAGMPNAGLDWIKSVHSHFSRHSDSGVVMKVFYVMSHQLTAPEVLDALYQKIMLLYPVRNLHFAKVERFQQFETSFVAKFLKVVDMPPLKKVEADLLHRKKSSPLDLLRDETTLILNRSRLGKWQKKFNHSVMFLASPTTLQSNTKKV